MNHEAHDDHEDHFLKKKTFVFFVTFVVENSGRTRAVR